MARSALTCVALVAILLIAGCGSTMDPVTRHNAIPASAVKIYSQPPGEYEMVSVVTYALPADMTLDQYSNADAAFEGLKDAAAAEGANGLLFDAIPIEGTQHYTLVKYHGKTYTVDTKMQPRRVMARAIYVGKEK